jgi:hypothetical protein
MSIPVGEKPVKKFKPKFISAGGNLLGINWAIWAFIVTAVLNFIGAITTGSILNIVACTACVIGLAGVVKAID